MATRRLGGPAGGRGHGCRECSWQAGRAGAQRTDGRARGRATSERAQTRGQHEANLAGGPAGRRAGGYSGDSLGPITAQPMGAAARLAFHTLPAEK
jgi:hypothetical protein